MDLRRSFEQLAAQLGPGYITPSIYDTAWIARLASLDIPMGKRALEWIRNHQLPDGSWGTWGVSYHHERLVCTLASITALAAQRDIRDQQAIRRAQSALEIHASGLRADPAGDTIGFEMIVPALLSEAVSLGALRLESIFFGDLLKRRKAKLAALPDGMINRYVTVAFSTEMISAEEKRLLDLDRLREPNGSVACSPASTAWYMLNIEPDDAALQYLESIIVDAESDEPALVPYIAPIDVFEVAWALWNLGLTDLVNDEELLARCQHQVDFLEQNWQPGLGVSAVSPLSLVDGDTTAMVYDVLVQFGRSPCLDDVLVYEEESCFRCFKIEADKSVSTNVHVLGALRRAGLDKKHTVVKKVRTFLRDKLKLGAYWFDKWHASPYYTTSHAIIACAEYDNALVETAAGWLIQTQHDDGSWGYYTSTAEETAYCLQALVFWHRSGQYVPKDTLIRGEDWLLDHMTDSFPPLWIGKCLYSPVLAVQAAILSALKLLDETL
ncbi:MAG: cyclase [Chloroflexota bacterium]